MSEFIPFSTKTTPEKQVFVAAIQAVNQIIDTHNGAAMTFAEDENHFGVLNGAELQDTDVVGRQAVIEGRFGGVTYELWFRLFNEAAGMVKSSGAITIADLRILASEGDTSQLQSGTPDIETKGQVAGLIWFDMDGGVITDFDHGTGPSADVNVQSVLNKLVGIYGYEPEELFSYYHNQTVRHDTVSLERLVTGLVKIGHTQSIDQLLAG